MGRQIWTIWAGAGGRRNNGNRKRKKKKETEHVRSRSANGMDTTEWRNGGNSSKDAKPCITKKYQRYPQQQHQHQHHHITTFFFFHHQHNTTQYHTSNSKCKSIDSHTRTRRCRLYIVRKSYEVTKNLSYLWAVTRCRQVFGIVGEDGTMTFSTYSR